MTITSGTIGFGKLSNWKVETFVISARCINRLPELAPIGRSFAALMVFNVAWDTDDFSRFSEKLLQSGAEAFGFSGMLCDRAENVVDENRIEIEEKRGNCSIPTIVFNDEPMKESIEMLLGVYIANREDVPESPALMVYHIGSRDHFTKMVEQLNRI